MPSALASRGFVIVTGSPSMRISPESAGWAPDSDAHQRRLAGAVAADQPDDLAREEVDGDAVDGVDAAERDADVAHLDERGGSAASARRPGPARRRLGCAGRLIGHLMPPLISPAGGGSVSKPTAATRTRPTTMSWTGESTPSRTMPDCSDCMTTAPRTAPGIVPMPPANDVPPMTAAAMTYSSSACPRPTVAAFRRAVRTAALTAREDAHQRRTSHDRALGVDAGEVGRVGVAADREDVAAEPPPRREDTS